MAAITPHVEEYESTPEELKYAECSSGTGLGSLAGRSCPSATEIVSLRHGKNVRMGMTRQALEAEISDMRQRGISVRAQFGTSDGKNKNELFLVLVNRDGTPARVGSRGPEWNSHIEGLGNFKVLAWTSKMDAPSFSLPAGAQEVGGACPGAVAGQATSVNNSSFAEQARLVQLKTKYTVAPKSPVWFADAICDGCYAGVGNYAYASKQLAALLLFAWTKQAITNARPRAYDGAPSNEFVELMVEAIDRAAYVSDRLSKQHKVRFFRIHDSGDFFNPRYLQAWKDIANRFLRNNPEGREPVIFWAPTRIWATPWGDEAVKRINTPANNLVIRPSAYHINTAALPSGPGYAAGSTVTAKGHIEQAKADGAFEWNCPAYDGAQDHSCTAAKAPGGKPGCRACWTLPDMTINYKLH